MNVLIVHAHPEPQSFCTSMRDTAREVLVAAGHTVEISDLHAQRFNPVASADDFSIRKDPDYLRYALEQRHAVDTASLPADIRAEIEKIQRCDLLILTFPLYWFALPAMMKGWIDRVFVSGLFYGGRRIYDRGGMKGKKALVAVTLGGREHMFGSDAIHGDFNTMLRPLLQGSLAYVGFSVLPPFAAWHVPYLPAPERDAIMARWRETLAQIDTLVPLPMPQMAGYDDTLKPLAPAAG